MASNVTLSQLRMLARLYADERPAESNGFLTEKELDDIINLELRSLYDRLIAARGHDYYESSTTIAVVANTSTYALPADFYEARRLQLEWAARDIERVNDYKKDEELYYTNVATWGPWSAKAWRIVAGNIKLVPTPTSAVTARLLYIPALAELKGNGATFDGVNGWHDAVALSVAIKMLRMQKLDAARLEEDRNDVLRRIDEMAADRAASERHRVIDVEPENDYYRYRGRLHGLPRP